MTVTHTHHDGAGKEVLVEIYALPVLDDSGEVRYVMETCRDITDRVQADRALRLTQFSVDHAGDAVLWVAGDARIVYANDSACEHLEYSHDEMLSLKVYDIDPNFSPGTWPSHWEHLKQQRMFTFESQQRTKRGRLVPVEITVSYLEFGGREYHCAFCRDITERKRAEEVILQLNAGCSAQPRAGDIHRRRLPRLAPAAARDWRVLRTSRLGIRREARRQREVLPQPHGQGSPAHGSPHRGPNGTLARRAGGNRANSGRSEARWRGRLPRGSARVSPNAMCSSSSRRA